MTASLALKPVGLQIWELQSLPRLTLLPQEKAFRPEEQWMHEQPQPVFSMRSSVCWTTLDKEREKSGWTQVCVGVVYWIANMSYKSNACWLSLQHQGRWLFFFFLSLLNPTLVELGSFWQVKSDLMNLEKTSLRFICFFQRIEHRAMDLGMLFMNCVILSSFVMNNRVVFQKPEFYHQLSSELLEDFLNYFPVFLLFIISFLKLAFRHFH